MTQQEIIEGIKLVCSTSKTIQNCYESKHKLVDEINNAKDEDIEKCWQYYKDRSGVVVDVRKELFKLIREGNKVTVKLLDDLVLKYKEGKENQFRVYKNFYTIFYPAITLYGHNPLREFIKNFENKLIVDLEIENEVKTTSFDFQGARQQGSDRYWLAIYNKEQQNQSTGLQFFIDFHHGNMSYGVYKHGNRDYLKERVVVTPETFSYDDLLVYFKTEVNDLINDLPKYDNITSIDLGSHNLYKVSHGTFKAKNKSHIIESLKKNNWIILHENTGKDQSRYFKEDLHKGDYVYITLGSKELIGIAKIISEGWDYVPNEIVDSDGWMYREVEYIKAPTRKSPKELKDTRNIYPSGNSTLTEIKFGHLEEANDKLFKPYFNVEFYNSEIVTNLENDQQKRNNILKPLNQILYGPPGTGKTYNTINKAVQIANPHFEVDKSLNSNEKRKLIKDEYHRLVDAGQIVFTTFHQSMTYEDFIEGIKPETKNDSVIYNIKNGLFKEIVNKSLDNWKKSTSGTKEIKPFDKVFQLLKDEWEENPMIEFPMKREGNNFKILGFTDNSINFLKASGTSNHTLSINTLRDLYYGIREFQNQGVGIYYPSIVDKLNSYDIDVETDFISSEIKNFVLIVDEINRGNVSQIFGELITLIEEDKRLGNDEAIEVALPYSKDKFGVPSNLYIIGTMNTADRSVEALDTALRRRFVFEEMPPKYDLEGLQQGLYGFKAAEILQTINKRIEKLLDRDHQIGHAYFINKNETTIIDSFYKNIIPLLQEYFFGDYGKIGLVLGSGFVDVDKQDQQNQTKSVFASFDYENAQDFDEKKSFKILALNDKDFNFENAIKLLMNQ